jgi:hypothetical protein
MTSSGDLVTGTSWPDIGRTEGEPGRLRVDRSLRKASQRTHAVQAGRDRSWRRQSRRCHPGSGRSNFRNRRQRPEASRACAIPETGLESQPCPVKAGLAARQRHHQDRSPRPDRPTANSSGLAAGGGQAGPTEWPVGRPRRPRAHRPLLLEPLRLPAGADPRTRDRPDPSSSPTFHSQVSRRWPGRRRSRSRTGSAARAARAPAGS